MKKGLAFALAALTSWTVGSTLGTAPPAARLSAAPRFVVGRAHHAEYLPKLDGAGPIYVLVIGSDSRPGRTPVDRGHSDLMQLVGINAETREASIIGFHRDTWIPIPGHDTTRLNTAMAYEGPELTVKAIEDLTGIRIDYYVLTSFEGFRNIIDRIGGLNVTIPYAIHDSNGHDFKPGPATLDGAQALAFARNRHDTPNGVFSRTINQQRMLEALLRQFQEGFAEHPDILLEWLAAGLPNVEADLPFTEMLTLMMTAAQLPPENVNHTLVPVTPGTAGQASVAFLKKAQAQRVFADMRDDGLLNGSA